MPHSEKLGERIAEQGSPATESWDSGEKLELRNLCRLLIAKAGYVRCQ